MQNIYGNTQGIRASQIKRLQQLYEQREPGDRFITPEFAQILAQMSKDIHHQICCYVNRRGQVIRVAIGTPIQTQIPADELPRRSANRLSGIRCITTQFKSEPPDDAALVAMTHQRLDALIFLTVVDSQVDDTFLAYLFPDPENPWVVSPPLTLDDLTEQEFDVLVAEWEDQITDAGEGVFSSQDIGSTQDKVLLVGVQTEDISSRRFEDGLAELVHLVESAGGIVLDTMQQKRDRPHPQTVVGKGKVEEITLLAQKVGANLIVFDRDISASQARNLEQEIGIPVVDRTEVILDIFAQRARTQEGKLQVELAQLEYMLPRLRGRGQEMSRLGAGIGTRGPGETKLETERRVIQRRIAQLQQEVNQLQAHRARIRQQRQQQEIPVLALVGYTNAGKSTLLNVLTNAEVYTADQLFATLDPTTRKIVITEPKTQQRRSILLTDTVGFIHELPPSLMDAFRATLEEVVEADALLHVVDLSHPAWEDHIVSVEEILADMPEIPGKSVIVFNKIDRVYRQTLVEAQQMYPEAVFISAIERLGLETLKMRSLQLIDKPLEAIAIPQNSY
ncbi:GTP-binding protein HSR1-related protein [Tolypothrix tenuis PCC 7101]|uniref:GTPase HflX n=1 Tax=Tolypothrix tenuis PCC 7101 TaxID=231146 RepID=A0A1Z4N0K8_9CYAN|nr:GTPase HflX [Aulosira sp. FACHB-113]BAY99253.1 GTP-binding protein HSR1-related protein [Tolypothrix tenuis PCC 7101]BAZ76824.1 GTP-binding protein HSR1-related protein [Aulosira laxa NIES-50]